MQLVKPGAAVQDHRAEEEREKSLMEQTSRNLLHVQKQLSAHGLSVEQVIAAAAKNAFGVNIQPHAPKPKQQAA